MNDDLVKRLRDPNGLADSVLSENERKEAADRIEDLETENARLWDALDKALERLEASAFTNAEHAQAAEILRAALRDKGIG